MKCALSIALRQNDHSLRTVGVADERQCRQRDECKPVTR